MILALPTHELLGRIAGRKVLELGAGTGLWLRIMHEAGIDAIGLDPKPRGDGVIAGDHGDVVAWPDRDLLLMVWPPDATDVAEWARSWRGDLLVVGNFARFRCPDWPVLWRMDLPPGHKGGNEARMVGAER